MKALIHDTIAASATPPGRGGIGVIRISGKQAFSILQSLVPGGKQFKPRYAHFAQFLDADQNAIDEGIVLCFPGPNSFTGEDVVELHGHGGPVVVSTLLNRVIESGARMANPGEFSERAFLNDKIDLAQAEAIADLIDSASEQAARCAIRSLQGEFSLKIRGLVEKLTLLRMYVEAAIDFPEEEIDFLADGRVQQDLEEIDRNLEDVFKEANRGLILKEGMNVVLAGRPNAGKSSLLNALSGRETAIVTPIPGTTRDLLREHIHIDGMPLHIIDTAGLRESPDEIEKEGIRRAWAEIGKADRVLLLVDATDTADCNPETIWPEFIEHMTDLSKVTVIRNKIDLTGEPAQTATFKTPVISLSAKQATGLDLLKAHLKSIMGYESGEGGFIARQRHVDALVKARDSLHQGFKQLVQAGAGELLAEDLRIAQEALAEITGQFTPDDLLGKIFSSFCIGK